MVRFFIGLLALLGVAAAAIAMQPGNFHIERSIIIAAHPWEVYQRVNNLRAWNDWSPWVEMDPGAKITYQGPAAGIGAVMHWAGEKSGEGRMTITGNQQDSRIAFRLDFQKPFQDTSAADFTFMPERSRTRVTWAMHGQKSFPAKVLGLIFNCDKMVGDQFDKGLMKLKTVTENSGG